MAANVERVSGQQLEWFFTQWLTRPGVPKIEGSWRYDAMKKVVEVSLIQSQSAQPYRVRLDVGITAKAGELPRVETIDATFKEGTFTFPADTAPVAVTLDPNTTLLMEAGAFIKKP